MWAWASTMNFTILPPALRLLMRMQMRARWRTMLRGARTVKGALYLCVMLGLFSMSLVPALMALLLNQKSDPGMIRPFLAPALVLYCVLTLVSSGPESGIFFLPAEVDFLFPAPFSRRDLLLYKLGGMTLSVFLVSLMFSTFLFPLVPHWILGFAGVFLAMSFIVLFPTAVTQVIAIAGERAYTRGRKVVLGTIGLALAVAAGQALARGTGGSVFGFLKELSASRAGVWLQAPFDVFAQVITAPRVVPEFAGWGALAFGIDALLVVLILRLDANFLESSIAASQKLYQKLERARRGQVWANLARPSGARWHLPQFPRCRGAGPVAWRQITAAVRGSRGMAYMLAAIGFLVALPALMIGRHETGLQTIPSAMMLLMMSLFMLPQMLQFDFRSDLERLDVLKTLPAPAGAIALGQLVTPVIFATLLEMPLVAALGIIQGHWSFALTAVALILPPVNLLVFALENLVFLWYPHRLTAMGAADIQMIGRQLIMMVVKMTIVFLGGGLAAGVGALAWWLSGNSWTAFLAGAWLVVTALGLSLVPLIAHAFRRFDPSLDTAD
jgi:hypothetical protein